MLNLEESKKCLISLQKFSKKADTLSNIIQILLYLLKNPISLRFEASRDNANY